MDLHQMAGTLIEREPEAPDPSQWTGQNMYTRKSAQEYPGLERTSWFENFIKISRHQGRARTMLSSMFWQVIASSVFFRRVMDGLGIEDPIGSGGRLILSMHKTGQNRRFDLLVLSPQLKAAQAGSINLIQLFLGHGIQVGEFAENLRDWAHAYVEKLDELRREGQLTEQSLEGWEPFLAGLIVGEGNYYFVEEIAASQQFSLIFAPMPATVFTSGTVSPAWGIALQQGAPPTSSVGVVTSDQQGRFGVTACLHGMVPDPETIYDLFKERGAACVVGKTVYVGDRPGIIRSADLITDSCFIELNQKEISDRVVRPCQPLVDDSPRRKEPVRFDGLTSKNQSTFITEVDLSIPLVKRGVQAKVYTDAVTSPGDSGSALINNEGYVLGFSHSRTGLGEPIEFAEWIWAQSVYNELKLGNPTGRGRIIK
ncbi:MAG TPA: hypothetical protein VJ302_24590 [Blastocatellia bacterium]|nr:hypothetical protein [Blastocatellia bacterium]